MYEAVMKDYHEDRPLHLAQPERSVFKILGRQEWDQLGPRGVQQYLRTQCLVIPDHHSPASGFNAETWRELLECGLHKRVDVTGKLILVQFTTFFFIFQ
jgi:hypothetical protein